MKCPPGIVYSGGFHSVSLLLADEQTECSGALAGGGKLGQAIIGHCSISGVIQQAWAIGVDTINDVKA